LRFTRELSLSEPDFGVLRSSVAVASLVAVLGSGWVVDRLRPSRTLAIAWFGCGLASLVMGLSDSLHVTVIAYAIYAPLLTTCSVPLSLWASRIAEGDGVEGPGQTTVFTVAKVFQSGITMLSMALLGVLEPLLGMTTLMWCGGLLALPFALGILRLGVAQKI
jgi:sugar phosphate permease